MHQPFLPPLVTLRQLQYIVAVADLGGFGRAAVQCHVAQPSLSTQVAQAEQLLGVRIFERRRSGVQVSAPGAAVVEQARRVLHAARDLEATAADRRDPFRGTLRIGVLPTVGPYLLPDVAPALARAYPHLTIVWHEDRTASLVRLIDEARLDGAVVALESDLDALEHAQLAWDPFVLAVGPRHPLARRRGAVAPGALRSQSVLLLDDGHCFRDQAWGLCAPLGVREMNYRATSLSTLVQMVSSGQSVTLLPSLALAVENRTRQLVVRRFSPAGPGRTLVLAWRRDSALRSALAALAGTIQAAIAAPRREPTSRVRTQAGG
jgi:LysR family hydrogen peroxide-inducible transcriptional activator